MSTDHRELLEKGVRESVKGIGRSYVYLRSHKVVLFWLLLAIGFDLFGILIVGTMILTAGSVGLTNMAPDFFATKLYRAYPILSDWKRMNGLRDLTKAHLTAFGVMGLTMAAWIVNLKDVMLRKGIELDAETWKVENHQVLWRLGGSVLLLADAAAIFYGLMSMSGWNEISNIVGAVIVTTLYLCLIVGFAYGNVVLWRKVKGASRG